LAKNLESVELEMPIEVVDIDVYPDVAIEYGVRSVPTLIMVEDSTVFKKMVGVKTVQELKEWVTHD
jgi:thioredoxin 1